MAQQLASSLRGYFTNTPNPRANQLGAMDRAYNTDVADQPQTLFRNAVNLPEPVVYLVADTNMTEPLPVSCIFSIDTPGGLQNTGRHYAFVGDVPGPGATPPILEVDDTIFNLVGPYRVNTYAAMAAAWTNAQPDDNYLGRPGNPAAEDVTVRHAVPVPHEYTTEILEAHQNGHLTFRWLHNNVLAPMRTDPVKAAAYGNFGNWIRAASTLGAADAPSPVDLVYQAVFGVPQVIARAPRILAQHLPGLATPTDLHGTLNQMTQHQQQMVQQMQQATMAAGQPRTKTLQEVNPNLHDQVLKLCEKPTIAQCPTFWQRMHLVPKGGHLPLALQELSKNGAVENMISPAFATDLVLGNWVPSDPTKLTEGLAFTRLSTYMTPTATQMRRSETNRSYQILGMVDVATPMMTELVLQETDANIPHNASMLRAQVSSFLKLLVPFWGPDTQHTVAFREGLHDKMEHIELMIHRDYRNQEKAVCLIITLWIVRTMRQAYIELLDGPVPTAANPCPIVQEPPYMDVYQALMQGNIMKLQDVPDELVQTRRPVAAPAQPRAPVPAHRPPNGPPPPPAPVAQGGAAAGQNPRIPIRNPNQNPRLKQAWIRGGDPARSLYQRAGDPFYDAALPPSNKVVVMRLAGDLQQRICLPMACKGVCSSNCGGYHGELTPGEEEAVAAAATPPLNL